MLRALFFAVAITTGLLLFSTAHSNATPSNGSLLAPGDVAPGNYWATPTDSIGGYVEVCADYQCDIGSGLIENYSVDGRTMVVVPYSARHGQCRSRIADAGKRFRVWYRLVRLWTRSRRCSKPSSWGADMSRRTHSRRNVSNLVCLRQPGSTCILRQRVS